MNKLTVLVTAMFFSQSSLAKELLSQNLTVNLDTKLVSCQHIGPGAFQTEGDYLTIKGSDGISFDFDSLLANSSLPVWADERTFLVRDCETALNEFKKKADQNGIIEVNAKRTILTDSTLGTTTAVNGDLIFTCRKNIREEITLNLPSNLKAIKSTYLDLGQQLNKPIDNQCAEGKTATTGRMRLLPQAADALSCQYILSKNQFKIQIESRGESQMASLPYYLSETSYKTYGTCVSALGALLLKSEATDAGNGGEITLARQKIERFGADKLKVTVETELQGMMFKGTEEFLLK
jgi:hypothetical protein